MRQRTLEQERITELEPFLTKRGRLSWTIRNDDGLRLHEALIRSGRTDLLAKAAEKISKKDASDPELSGIWAEVICFLLNGYQKTAVLAMIEKGALKYMEDEETKAVMQAVLARRDIKLADAAVRYTKCIPAAERDERLSVSSGDRRRQGGDVCAPSAYPPGWNPR